MKRCKRFGDMSRINSAEKTGHSFGFVEDLFYRTLDPSFTLSLPFTYSMTTTSKTEIPHNDDSTDTAESSTNEYMLRSVECFDTMVDLLFIGDEKIINLSEKLAESIWLESIPILEDPALYCKDLPVLELNASGGSTKRRSSFGVYSFENKKRVYKP
jgi:hypothetical protein